MANVGNRIFKNIQRPSPELTAGFRGIPSSNICDTMGRLYCMDSGIHPLTKEPLLGTAFTVKAPAGDNLFFHLALDMAMPGDILVVDAQGCMERSVAGEIMVTYAKSRGIAGIVVNGCMRDADAIAGIGLPVYCMGITPQGPYKHGPGEINVPVCCAGQVVMPGDILVGDQDGIVVIRPEDAPDVLREARLKLDGETVLLDNYGNGVFDYDEHLDTYSRMAAKNGTVCL